MNKTELIEAIALRSELTKFEVDTIISSFTDIISNALAEGEKVSLKRFGTFEVRERKARTGRNPHTGETIEIKASKSPTFKPSSVLKKIVNQGE